MSSQRVAIVTGAGSGFGAGIARKFAKDGVNVVVADINDDAGRKVTEEINKAGKGKAVYVHCDVAKRDGWDNLLAETKKAFGGVNFIINNAGATYKSKPVLETTEKDFDLCIDVNLKSVFHSVHVMIPALREARKAGGPAVMINVASTAGIMGRPGLTWYCGSKAAVISCTKNLSIEFGAEQIRFNAICPVIGNTGLKHMFVGEASEEAFLKTIPLGRCSEPEAPRTAHLHGSDSEVDELVEATVRRWCLPRRTRLGDRFFAYVTDIANATVFLCTDEASFLTGVALPVDGGRLA